MQYILLIHLMFAIWVLIDGHRRRMNGILWAITAILLGPIILHHYLAKRPLKPDEHWESWNMHNFLKCLALFWAILLAATSIWSGKAPTNTTKNEALEYRLAVISTGGSVIEGDPIIDRFDSLLDQLSQNYVEDRLQIANMSIIIRDKMKTNGTDESLLQIMEGLNKLLWPQDFKKRRYSEYAMTYVFLRNQGLAHQEAIERLQAEISGY